MKRSKRKAPSSRDLDDEQTATKKTKGHSRVGLGGIPHLNPFVEMLKSSLVEEAVPSRRIIVLDDTNTVLEALKLLSAYSIQSAPVLDLVKKGFLGFVDVLDILSFIVSFFEPGEELDTNLLEERSQQVLSHPITNVIGKSSRLTACDIHKTSSLWEAIGIFQRGAHRLPITNEDGIIVNLISQTDVLRFLMSQRDLFDKVFDSTAEDLKLGRHPAKTCHQDQSTLTALQKMEKESLSALAIVNNKNELVGNLSASDLKGVTMTDEDPGSNPLGCLLLPVKAFLDQNGKRDVVPASCTTKSTLGSIIEQMITMGFHRIWVTDNNNQVKSVITITDVMRAIVQQNPKSFKEEQRLNKMAFQKGGVI